MPERWTETQMMILAARAVHKVDLLGPRGITLCSMDEIAAMAGVIAASGALPPPEELKRMEEAQTQPQGDPQ